MQDTNINQLKDIIYFLSSPEIDTVFDPTLDSVSENGNYGSNRCGERNYEIVKELTLEPGPVSTTVL